MLSDDPQRILEEIEASIKFRDEHLTQLDEIVQGYTGTGYKSGGIVDMHENYAYEWVSMMSAKLAFALPRQKVNAGNDPASIFEASGLERAANRWMRKSNYSELLSRQVVDFGFMYGITVVAPQILPGDENHESPLYLPVIELLDIRDVVWDRLAKSFDKKRFIAHRVVVDKEDLLKRAEDFPDEGWDSAAIAAMAVDGVRRDGNTGTGPLRGEVEYYQVWIPEREAKLTEEQQKQQTMSAKNGDKLYHGSIHCVAYVAAKKSSGSLNMGARIRAPRAYFGPREGPYTLHGCHHVRNEVYPLSPVLACKHQTDELNKQVLLGIADANSYKKITAYDGLSEGDADALANSQNGDRVKVMGLDKNKVVDIESGGMADPRAQVIEFLRARADRNIGTSDAGRGMVSGKGTATENAIADSSSGTRVSHIANRFRSGVNKDQRKLDWYLRNDYRTAFKLDDGSLYLGGYDKVKAVNYAAARGVLKPELAEMMVGVWESREKIQRAVQDGASEGVQVEIPDEVRQILTLMSDERVAFPDLDIEIEAYSMERTDEALQQRRLVEGGNMMINQIPLVTQFPFFDWKRWFDIMGESLNLPSLGSMLDVQGMQQAQAQAQQLAMMEAQGAPQEQPTAQRQPPTMMGGASASKPSSGSGGLPGNASGSKAGAAAKTGKIT